VPDQPNHKQYRLDLLASNKHVIWA